MTRLPRILYAVPRTLHVHLEIAKAIQTLAVPEKGSRYHRRSTPRLPILTPNSSSVARVNSTIRKLRSWANTRSSESIVS